MTHLPHLFLAAVALLVGAAAHSDSLSTMSNEADGKTQVGRVKAAQALLKDIERFAGLLRAPTPSEDSWLETEQTAIARIANSDNQTVRRLQLLRTPEFQQARLYRHLQEIRNAALCASDQSLNLRRQIHCWAVAAFLLDDNFLFDDGVKVLLRSGRLPPDTPNRVGVATEDGIQLRYRMVSRNIYEYVVVPFLAGRLNEAPR